MARRWDLLAANTIFDGHGEKFFNFLMDPPFLPLWLRYDAACRVRCIRHGMSRRVQHMSAVLGLPEWIRNSDCKTIDNATLQPGTESSLLFLFITEVIEANQSEGGLFSTQNNTVEMVRRYNKTLNFVDIFLHAATDQVPPYEFSLSPPAMMDDWSDSVVEIERPPSTPDLEIISPFPNAVTSDSAGTLDPSSIIKMEEAQEEEEEEEEEEEGEEIRGCLTLSEEEALERVGTAQIRAISPDRDIGLRRPLSLPPPHPRAEDDNRSTTTAAITAHSQERIVPTLQEVRAAIPPQGATFRQLIEVLMGRTAVGEGNTATAAKSQKGRFPTIPEIRAATPPGGTTMHQLTEIFKGRFTGGEREFSIAVRRAGIRVVGMWRQRRHSR